MPLILKIHKIMYLQFKVLVKTDKFFISKLLFISNVFHGLGRNYTVFESKHLGVNTWGNLILT